ncbi:DUF4309 domain-containing protein [Staphylospora marina]|uniref:DUF4309 domain-containing protein n=1 Tax=Staphylospora marina TaxID=2490858 RepID=UPI000F5C083C|nr:DUF4309 domain-containing protein [Staphylospora marina]
MDDKVQEHVPLEQEKDPLNQDAEEMLENEPVIPSRKTKEESQANQRKKRMIKAVSWFFTIIVLPVTMTILLAAYEDETNQWVRSLFEEEKPETFLESMKRLTAEGKLPVFECGPLRATQAEVTNRCGQPVAWKHWWTEDENLMSSLFYVYEDKKRSVLLTFKNDRLQRLFVMDGEHASTSLEEMKQVFGKPAQSNEGSNYATDSTYYEYVISEYKLQFWYNRKTGKLENYSYEDSQTFPMPPNINVPQFKAKEHPVPGNKRIPTGDGLAAARQLQRWIAEGDLGNYDCGPLGTSYLEVKTGRCGEYHQHLMIWEEDNQQHEKGLYYVFKDRIINLDFYKDSLTSISVQEEEGKNYGITKKQIKRVFGTPQRENDDTETKMGVKVEYLEYKIGDNLVYFGFDKEGKLYYIWIRKNGLYTKDGFLVPPKE